MGTFSKIKGSCLLLREKHRYKKINLLQAKDSSQRCTNIKKEMNLSLLNINKVFSL